MKEESLNKVPKILMNIILILLVIGAIQMFFDDNYRNDHFGWLFLIGFWMVRCLYGFIVSFKKGEKKLALVDLVLGIVAFYFLVSRSINYFI
ncbi:hypothetical protein JI666_04075 [Bacillus sp. NTK071]|uniref:hypothetical protein n=1 Tax=Bacillus sp. NTK071 TaxID=2802175 RepID=UPI001A8CE4B8|nr:hypothetical protein [Bacillus sp. NTK071]MBN8207920.1 hypothetical protein [Bacillus sp. NTK071]